MNRHTKTYTLASRSNQSSNQSFQESMFFASPERNSKYYSPTLRCFNFFCQRTVLNRTDIASIVNRFGQSVSKLDTTHLRTDRRATDNMGYTTMAGDVVNQTFVLLINGNGKLTVGASKPPLRVAPNLCAIPYDDSAKIELTDKIYKFVL